MGRFQGLDLPLCPQLEAVGPGFPFSELFLSGYLWY